MDASAVTQASSIAATMGFSIPPSATVELADYQRGLDDNAHLLLVMPTADWKRLRAAAPFEAIPEQAFTQGNLFHLGEDEGKWMPSSDPGLVAAQAPLRNGRALNVGVSRIGKDRVRLFLFWFQT